MERLRTSLNACKFVTGIQFNYAAGACPLRNCEMNIYLQIPVILWDKPRVFSHRQAYFCVFWKRLSLRWRCLSFCLSVADFTSFQLFDVGSDFPSLWTLTWHKIKLLKVKFKEISVRLGQRHTLNAGECKTSQNWSNRFF